MRQVYLTYLCFLCCCGLFAQADFSDIAAQAGIDNLSNARSVAICDYDNDGDDDVFFGNTNHPNALYRNNGDLTFTDVTVEAGVYDGDSWTICSSWADYDNDGNIDLYIGNHNQANTLYKNNGDGTFTDVTINTGVGDSGFCRSAIWADVNGDNFVDLYVANMNMSNLMYINQGGEYFLDAVDETNTDDNLVAQASIFFDYDNDSDLDLYLVHDADQANILYKNNGEVFQNVAPAAGVNFEGNGMGVDAADYNGDGLMDLFFSNLGHNTLMSNNGDGTFSDISTDAGVFPGGMGWSTFWLDYNNDRHPDIFICMDANFAPVPAMLYENQGDSTFVNVAEGDDVGNSVPGFGAASLDANLDGRLDIVAGVNGLANLNQLLLNESETGNWIGLTLEGVESNFCAIGARIEIVHAEGTQIDEIHAGTGWASQNSFRVHFGLGEIEEVEEITIRWPSGFVESFDEFDINEYHHVVEGQSLWVDPPPPPDPDFGNSMLPGEEDDFDIEIGIEEESNQASLIVYPNPTSNRLLVQSSSYNPILLFNAQGNLVSESAKLMTMLQLDVSILTPGLYFLRQGKEVVSFVKE